MELLKNTVLKKSGLKIDHRAKNQDAESNRSKPAFWLISVSVA